MSGERFACMRRVGPGFYDDGHGGLHVDIGELVRAAGGDPCREADVDRAVELVRECAGGTPVLVLGGER